MLLIVTNNINIDLIKMHGFVKLQLHPHHKLGKGTWQSSGSRTGQGTEQRLLHFRGFT